jgi:peptidoglycan/xylan/chitin deacetylase (PgdA/CDA1 family)
MKRALVVLVAGLGGTALLAAVVAVLLGLQGLAGGVAAIIGSAAHPKTEPTPAADEAGQEPGEQPVQQGSARHRKVRPLIPAGEKPRYDCAKVSCVALTFDDGPGPYTSRLLTTLAQHGVRATFFVVGTMVKENPELLRDEVAAGHEIGNHTWDHSDLSQLSRRRMRAELNDTHELIRTTAGVTPRLIRPPYGGTSGRVTRAARKMGTAQILWSVDPEDWRLKDSHKIAKKVVRGVHPGQIVLMHDINKATVDAVPAVLAALERKHYAFVTVSELLAGTAAEVGGVYRERPDPVGANG